MSIFSKIPLPKVGSSNFDLSHDLKLSFSMGKLIPTAVMDVLPGDKFDISIENMLRFAPLVAPVMHRVKITTHYFFVPNRILWPEWEKWITGDSDVAAPSMPLEFIQAGTLGDYLGYNNESTSQTLKCSPLAVAAYCKIYDEYYRDQNLQTEVFQPLTPGDTNDYYAAVADSNPFDRAWGHDYFTSALPWAQKGDEVLIPLGDGNNSLPVSLVPPDGTTPVVRRASDGGAQSGTVAGGAGTGNLTVGGSTPAVIDPNGTLEAVAENASINNLRRAFRLQEWLERNARGGTRYIENILSHFGVRSSDARLQRPEFIGSCRQNMTISEVLSTAQVAEGVGDIPQGNMAGHGISVAGSNNFRYTAEEHGFIIGIVSAIPDTAYQQGIPRMHTRLDRLEYAWPTFAHIGEQEVRMKELYTNFDDNSQYDAVFGYMPRYSEYRYMNSRVAGDFRTSLAYWHLGRIFQDPPALNEEFIRCNPSKRIFAVTEDAEHEIYAHIYNNVRVRRRLPKHSIPMM